MLKRTHLTRPPDAPRRIFHLALFSQETERLTETIGSLDTVRSRRHRLIVSPECTDVALFLHRVADLAAAAHGKGAYNAPGDRVGETVILLNILLRILAAPEHTLTTGSADGTVGPLFSGTTGSPFFLMQKL